RLWIGERRVVELPERVAALEPEHRHGGFGRGARVFVEGERGVLPDEPNFFRAVLVADLLQRRLDAAAERTLEITDGDDRHRCERVTPLRIFRSDGHAGTRLIGGVTR